MSADETIKSIRRALLERLSRHLIDQYDASQLDPGDTEELASKSTDVAWLIKGDPDLRVFVDAGFPYAPPKIALCDDDHLLVWPHVENAGRLCVFADETNIDPFEPELVADMLIREARLRIDLNVAGDIAQDFKDEFTSYWEHAVSENAPVYQSLVRPRGPTRKIRVWRGIGKSKRVRVFADTDEELENWLSNTYPKQPKEGWTFSDALLIWLPEPLTPNTYPKNASDVAKLITMGSGSERDFAPLLDLTTDADVLLGAPTDDGVGFGAVCLDKTDAKRAQKGFRPGHVPSQHLKRHATSAVRQAKRSSVERVDPEWVHGRDHNSELEHLLDCKVAIIGCGALGASVAVLLAQAGVRAFELIDGERLDRSNTARHPLGAEHVGNNKAQSLAKHLQKRFPHIDSIGTTPYHLTTDNVAELDRLVTHNLIISATGQWSSMGLISDATRRISVPLQTIWQEPEALAAHSVITLAHSSCLRCGFSRLGRPKLEATEKDEKQRWRQIPACGGVFTPYGAADLALTSGFCASQSLSALKAAPVTSHHSIWCANSDRLKSCGANISRTFSNAFGKVEQGGVFHRRWPTDDDCVVCGTSC